MSTNNQYSTEIDELLSRAEQQREEELYDNTETYDDDSDTEEVLEEEVELPKQDEVIESLRSDLRPLLNKYGNWDTFFFVIFSIAILISTSNWNTFYATKLRRLSEQELYLKDLRYRDLFTTAELVRLGRINNIENSIKELGLNLEHSTQPPYEVIDTLGSTKNE